MSESINKQMKEIIEDIARKHGISVDEVRQGIIEAIEAAWHDGNHEIAANLSRYFGNEVPTPEEFIHVMIRETSDRQNRLS